MSDLSIIVNNIFDSKDSGTYAVTLDEFRELYRLVARVCEEREKKLGETRILLLTESAITKFSLAPHVVIRVTNSRNLSKRDFDVVISPKFEGNIKPITLSAFVWTELRQNWWFFILVSIVFYFLFYKNNNYSGISTINQMLIDATSLFISIFVLFTISQNRGLLTNKELVRQGITHHLMQNDYYITSLAIFSLILTFTSSALLTLPVGSAISLPLSAYPIPLTIIAIFLTHLSLLSLLDCFRSVTRYYLKIVRTSIEGQMYTDLMSEDVDKSKTRARTGSK